MSARYFNWKLAAVLLISLAVLSAGAFALRQWHKSNRTEQGLERGSEAYDAGRWEEAAEHLNYYLNVRQDDVPVQLKYADACMNIRPVKSNNIARATNAYRAALRVDKNNTEAAMKLTEIYLAVGTPGEAELVARRQLETNRDPALRRMLALSLAAQRKFAEAAEELKSIVKEHPDQVRAYEALGQLVEQRPMDFRETPQQWFDEAVRNNPSSALAYVARAGFHRRSKNISAALADLEQAESKDLSDTDVRLRLAREFIDCGALDKAEAHLAAVRQTSPADQGLWHTWAQLALKSQSQEEMSSVARDGLKELASQPWDFMPLAAELFIRAADLNDANDCISRMAQKDIAPAAAAFLRGLIALERHDLPEAVKRWEQSMELGNRSEQVRLSLASALARLGDTQSALQQLRTLVSERPDSSEGHLATAKLLAQSGKWSEAAGYAARARELAPQNSEAALLCVQIQMQQALAASGDAGQTRVQWRDIEKQLSALNGGANASPELILLRFRFALQRGQLGEAQTLLNRLKATSFQPAGIVMAEVELLAAQDKIGEAVVQLTDAVEKFPQSAELVRRLAILLDRQGLRDKCEDVLKQALARIEDPIAERETGLLLAQFYTQWGRPDSVHTLLTALEAKLPNDIPIKRGLLLCGPVIRDSARAQKLVDDIKSIEGPAGWQWRYEQARVWFASDNFKDRYPQIASLLKENILANPNDQPSRLLLARSHERAGEMQLALLTYREALRISPDDLRVIIPTVAALYEAREFDEAEQVLSRASVQDMRHPELQKLMLQSYLRHGELDSASGVLQDLISTDPNNQAACLSLAFLQMQQKKFDEAAELLAKLKSRDPDSLSVAAAQIQLNIRQNNTDEALRLSDDIATRLGSAAAYILHARTCATLGRKDKAAAALDRAASIDANNVDVWVAMSDFHRSVGQSEEAAGDIQKALSLAGDDVRVQKRGIVLLLASKVPSKVREGRTLLAKALKSSPEDTDLQLLNSRVLIAEGTAPALDQAEAILRALTRDRPEVSDAWALLGEIAIERGQPEKALDAALRGLGYGPNDKKLLLLKANAEAMRSPVLALPTLRVLYESDPNNVEMAMLLADMHVKAGEAKKAMDLLRRQLPRCNESDARRCKIALAMAQYKNGQKAKAEKDLDALTSADPNDPAPLLAHVRILADDQLWDVLSDKLKVRYQSQPQDQQLFVNIADELRASANVQAKKVAEDLLRMVLADSPDSTAALGTLAILLLQTPGRSAEAALLYQRLLELEPENVVAINNLAWIRSEEQGRYAEALGLAEKGLAMSPQYFDLIDTRGTIYFRLGEYEKAVQDFTACMALYPRATPASIATRLRLAKALVQLGRKDKAIEQLNQILDSGPRVQGVSAADLSDAQRLLRQLQEGSQS